MFVSFVEDTGTWYSFRNKVASCERTHWKTLEGKMRSSYADADRGPLLDWIL